MHSLLSQTRAASKTQAFLAEGVRLVEEGIKAGATCQFILYSESLSERGMALINALPEDVPVYQVEPSLFNEISDTQTNQGLMAVFDIISLPIPEALDFILILDNIRDPGNMGTILRTAAAAGVQRILLTPGCTHAFAPKVVRAGMGAHFRLPIQKLSWKAIELICQDFLTYHADMEGKITCWQADFKQAVALIIGSEADGLSVSARKLSKTAVSIPMPGKSESLNAAVAAGILLFEVVHQRSLER